MLNNLVSYTHDVITNSSVGPLLGIDPGPTVHQVCATELHLGLISVLESCNVVETLGPWLHRGRMVVGSRVHLSHVSFVLFGLH